MVKRRRRILFAGVLAIGLIAAGCSPATTEYQLGQSFTLEPGETAAIKNEDLTITFKEVLNESRCADGAVCIWQGQVQCLLNVTADGKNEQLTLTQSGSGTAFQTYHQYYIEFDVTPYPSLGEAIKASDYGLELKISLIG
ncbi:MAG: hypothetical protein P3T54_01075 [Dehalogenimonas sp.]|uniref:SbsA Ig-like domain-containing protein n=1 Tax=Candidatus Dehalogenimonas loeffleri TaxID=3127115 RepID=A0ABZ2J5Q6_9CHLR|nr:hypothetical protein [Dehalogenimonas sp.]